MKTFICVFQLSGYAIGSNVALYFLSFVLEYKTIGPAMDTMFLGFQFKPSLWKRPKKVFKTYYRLNAMQVKSIVECNTFDLH